MVSLALIGEGLVELEFDPLSAQLALAPGGDAANIAVMAARLGTPVRLGGRVGGDPLGAWLLATWRDAGVDVEHVRLDPEAPTGLYLNAPGDDGEHRFHYWRRKSAGSRLTVEDLPDGFFADVALLVVTGVTLAVSASSAAAARHAMARARSQGARVACVLNHRPALGGDVATLAAVACTADIVVGSRQEADDVFGGRLGHDTCPVPELVLTDGGRPAVAIIDGEVIEQPVPPVEVVNAAGAGDALAGTYLAQRVAGCPPAEALAWGVAASAQSVTRRGCASSYPTRAEAAVLAEALLAAA